MKTKIRGIKNTDKIMWLKLFPSDANIKKLQKIITSLDKNSYGLKAAHRTKDAFLPKYKEQINRDFLFFPRNENMYIIVNETHINVILRRDGKYFNRIKKELLKNLDFPKYKDKTKKK